MSGLGKQKTQAGSFPQFKLHQALKAKGRKLWQVLCGDKNHWRVGCFSPSVDSAQKVSFLEKHTCPELFLLISGRITLIVDHGNGEREIELEPQKPVVVTGWHNGYAPEGPYTGTALVVERDHFTSTYRKRA